MDQNGKNIDFRHFTPLKWLLAPYISVNFVIFVIYEFLGWKYIELKRCAVYLKISPKKSPVSPTSTLMVYGQMGGVSYRRLGKTSITGECEDISVIPSRYVMFYLLPFLLCQKFIKHGIITPCFRSLKPRFYTPPICRVAFCMYKPSCLFKNTKHSFARNVYYSVITDCTN